MQRNKIFNSLLSSVGYDPERQILEIEFNTGRTFRYFDVEEQKFKDLVHSERLIDYFEEEIKNVHEYVEIME